MSEKCTHERIALKQPADLYEMVSGPHEGKTVYGIAWHCRDCPQGGVLNCDPLAGPVFDATSKEYRVDYEEGGNVANRVHP